MTGPTGIVVASRPCMLNSSVHAAPTAVKTHGRYSGLQPAITAAIATFSTVISTRSGGTVATMSDGARVVPASIAITRSSVGGTTGRPSVQPRLNIISTGSSAAATSTRRAVRTEPPKRTRSSSTRSGSTLIDPHPGRIGGRSGASELTPVNDSHAARDQPMVRLTSTPFSTLINVGTVSISWCQLTNKDVSSIAAGVSGKSGSSWLYTVRRTLPASCSSTGTTV